MMFFVVLNLCVASSLAKSSTDFYSGYSSYVPFSSPLAGYPPHYFSTPSIPVVGSAPSYNMKNHYESSYGLYKPHISYLDQGTVGNHADSFSYIEADHGQILRGDYIANLPVTPASVHSLYKRSLYSQSVPGLTPTGYLADTPEVAQAKVAHFAEHAKRGNYFGDIYSTPHINPYLSAYSVPPYQNLPHTPITPSYNPSYYRSQVPAPAAEVFVQPDGFLADTPEVAAAKAAHLAEKAKITSYSAVPAYQPHYGYSSISHPSKHITNTSEGAVAKSAHFAGHGSLNSRVPYFSHEYLPAPYSARSPLVHKQYLTSYQQTVPLITPSGHLADTPEVAQAKAAHYAEYAAIARRHKRSIITPPLISHSAHLSTPLGYSLATPLIDPIYSQPSPLLLPMSQPSLPLTHSYPSFQWVKPATNSAIIHGPHAFSYQSI